MKITLNNCKPAILVPLMALMLGACSKPESKQSSQVAAKVNDSEISVLQVNQVINNTPNVTAANAPEMRKQALDKLVDQQVILNKAYEEGLDRSPEVVSALEAAKREVIARAYLSRLVSSKVRLTDRELRKYYDDHPELFSERRIYSLQDIGVKKDAVDAAGLQEAVAKGPAIQDVAAWLKNSGVKFSASSYTRPAEQISLESLQKLRGLHDGEMVMVDSNDTYHVLRIVNASPSPMQYENAQSMIKNYLVNTQGQKLVMDEIKRLRTAANIQYVGVFADAGTTNAQQPAAEPKAIPVKAAEKPDSIGKGVAGLN